MNIELILSVSANEAETASKFNIPLAEKIYGFARGPRLKRGALPITGCEYMKIDGRGFSGVGSCRAAAFDIVRECLLFGYSGFILDFPYMAPEIQTFCSYAALIAAKNGLRAFVPCFTEKPPVGVFLCISSSVICGDLKSRLEDIRKARPGYDIALIIDRVSYDIPLPYRGEKHVLSRENAEQLISCNNSRAFCSEELCTNYSVYPSGDTLHAVFFDDAESIHRKLQIAESEGIKTVIVDYGDCHDLFTKYPSLDG